MATQNNTPKQDWNPYQQRAALKPANQILTDFISTHPEEIKTAVELGCGALSDSIYLASQGIQTVGVDGTINKDLVTTILNNQPQAVKNNLTLQQQSFENLTLPKADLVYSFASIPFCDKSQIGNLIGNIASSVNPNGYVLTHFFAKDHPFTIGQGTATGFTSQQLESVFSYLGFEVTTTEWQSTQNQLGQQLPNMNNILITGKAPEVLPEFNVDTINELLGLTPEQIETHNDVLSHYGLTPAESMSTQANNTTPVENSSQTGFETIKVDNVPPPITPPSAPEH
ncbi:MAG: class I SAM-dependent methyltransferase [Clostridia bacterium]|nr:class I SAM-dependent methyltransferase [Clostridia bacterium]